MGALPGLPPGLTGFDLLAVAVLLLAWQVCGWLIEHPPARHPSVTVLMRGYRREWIAQVISRDPRVFDAITMGSLRESTAFFASTTMIAIGGGVALIGNVGWLRELAGQFDVSRSAIEAWNIKLLLVVALVARAFLGFVWSNRLHGYCSIMIGAIPNDASDPRCAARIRQAGDLNIAAARHFGAGLRTVYFALGALGWLIGAWWLLATTAITVWWVMMREFASLSRRVMLEDGPPQEALRG